MASNFRSCPTLATRRILEHRPQRVERVARRQAVGVVEGTVAERHVARRRAARSRTAMPTIARAHRRSAVGEDARGRTRPAARESSASASHGVERVDDRGSRLATVSAVGANSLASARNPSSRRARSSARATARGSAAPRGRTRPARRCGCAPARGSARAGVRVGEQRLAVALLLDRPARREQRVERPVRDDQLARALLADARHALDVVDGVAHQRQHVDDLIGPRRRTSRFTPVGVVPGALVARVVDADAVADQLEEVLVARDDRDLEARPRAACTASVPITSSASKRSDVRIGTPSASHASWTAGSAPPGRRASARGWPCSRRRARRGTSRPGRSNDAAMYSGA